MIQFRIVVPFDKPGLDKPTRQVPVGIGNFLNGHQLQLEITAPMIYERIRLSVRLNMGLHPELSAMIMLLPGYFLRMEDHHTVTSTKHHGR